MPSCINQKNVNDLLVNDKSKLSSNIALFLKIKYTMSLERLYKNL